MRVILHQLRCFLDGETIGCDPGARHSLRQRIVGLALVCGCPVALSALPADSADYLKRKYDFAASAIPVGPASGTLRAIQVPRIEGRITRHDVGLVINTADPYSVEVGAFYIKARTLLESQVLRLQLPVRQALTPEEFESFAAKVNVFFGPPVQALVLAWAYPYAVGCNSITGALALGHDEALCANPCAASARSPYYNAASSKPFARLKMRPSMLLAARDTASAKAMIERGVAADGSLGLRGAAPVHAYYVATGDTARGVRQPLFPPPGLLQRAGIEVHTEMTPALQDLSRVLIYQTGAVNVPRLDTIRWVPGALADHLTSFGGRLEGGTGQMSILDWIDSGATASYGTVSEPCAHPQKFPHPQVLLLNYLQGASAIEAYWKSVAWPQQGVFIGEPLAAPFSRTR